MIDKNNVPGDLHSATIHYKASKHTLNDLLVDIKEHEYTDIHQLTGLINNYIEEVDKELECY